MPLSRITNPFLSVSGAGSVSITSPAANTIAFTTSGTEDMRINPTGNVGIGTTTPNFQLSFGANIGKTIAVFENAGTSVYGIGMGGAGTGGDPYRTKLFANGTEYASITDAGLFTVVGGQIKFPASQNASADANTLDDYEEGTWTPLAFHVSSNNPTFASRVGHYVKVGGIVHCWFLLDSGSSGTGGSVLKISGLPFTAASTNLAYGTGGIWSTNGTVRTGNVFINSSSALVQLYIGGGEMTEAQGFISGYFTFRVT